MSIFVLGSKTEGKSAHLPSVQNVSCKCIIGNHRTQALMNLEVDCDYKSNSKNTYYCSLPHYLNW